VFTFIESSIFKRVLPLYLDDDEYSDLQQFLTRIIHEHFCCNRRSAAPTSLRSAGSPLGPSTYYTSTPQVLPAPRAALATRLSDFATNRHE
jgi:hypothetical protein